LKISETQREVGFFLGCPKPRGQKFMAAWFVDLKISFHNWNQDLELAFGSWPLDSTSLAAPSFGPV
jgi:hypothetical protein